MECLIAFGGDRLCLVYPRVVSDSRVRSGYPDLVVVPLDIAWMECHVARRQIEPNPTHEVQGCGCILQCFLIARDATVALNDDKITEEEFRLIHSEVDKYNQMKAEIRGHQKHRGGLSEDEKTDYFSWRETKR